MIFVQRRPGRVRFVILPVLNILAPLAFLVLGAGILWGLSYEATLACDRTTCVARSGFPGLVTDEHTVPLARVVRAKLVVDGRFGQRFLGLREPDGTLSWLPLSAKSAPVGGDGAIADKLAEFLGNPAQATFRATSDDATSNPSAKWIGGLPFLVFGLLVAVLAVCLGVVDVDLDERRLRRRTWTLISRNAADVALADVASVELDESMVARTNTTARRIRVAAVLRMRDGPSVILSPERTNARGDADRLVELLQPVLEGRSDY